MQESINFMMTTFVVNTLIRKEGLQFSTDDLLNVYTVVWSKREPRTNLSTGNHYLWLKNDQQTWARLVTESHDKDLYLDEFFWVSGNWEFQDPYKGMWAFPKHNNKISDGECSAYWSYIHYLIALVIVLNMFL